VIVVSARNRSTHDLPNHIRRLSSRQRPRLAPTASSTTGTPSELSMKSSLGNESFTDRVAITSAHDFRTMFGRSFISSREACGLKRASPPSASNSARKVA
jgi:hypothetical protein